MSMRDEMRQLGYSKEDEYFFQKGEPIPQRGVTAPRPAAWPFTPPSCIARRH